MITQIQGSNWMTDLIHLNKQPHPFLLELCSILYNGNYGWIKKKKNNFLPEKWFDCLIAAFARWILIFKWFSGHSFGRCDWICSEHLRRVSRTSRTCQANSSISARCLLSSCCCASSRFFCCCIMYAWSSNFSVNVRFIFTINFFNSCTSPPFDWSIARLNTFKPPNFN